MIRLRLYIGSVLAAALLALAGLSTPSAGAAASVQCESTGGGTFSCSTTIVRPRYHWTSSSSATITQNLGAQARGACTVGTKPTVTVTGYSYVWPGPANSTAPPPVTASTSFTCSALAL